MSSSMPDSRRVSLAAVNTLAPSGIRSRTRARAAAASSRISTVKPCALSASAARSKRCAGAGSVNSAVGVGVVMVPPGFVAGDVLVSAVRQRSRGKCEATGRPHIFARCLVEVVRTEASEGNTGSMTIRSEPGHGGPDPGLDVIMSERRQLIGLTYRLLGSLAEAEDAVQETYARWYAMSRAEQEAIESPGAWLTTVASRICLNLLSSARARRETYVGEWIPEPLPGRMDWITGLPGGASLDPA